MSNLRNPIPEFPIESIVYLKVNPELKGMVVGYEVRQLGIGPYFVTWGEGDEKLHWPCELSDSKIFGEEGS